MLNNKIRITRKNDFSNSTAENKKISTVNPNKFYQYRVTKPQRHFSQPLLLFHYQITRNKWVVRKTIPAGGGYLRHEWSCLHKRLTKYAPRIVSKGSVATQYPNICRKVWPNLAVCRTYSSTPSFIGRSFPVCFR